MTVGAMELHGYFGEKFPLFSAERTRDVLAAYLAVRFPTGRRKAVAKEFGLSADEARSACEGSASQATLDKIWRHRNGGWRLLLPIFGVLLEQTVEEYLTEERRKHVELARRSGALVRDLRAVPSVPDSKSSELPDDSPRRRSASGG